MSFVAARRSAPHNQRMYSILKGKELDETAEQINPHEYKEVVDDLRSIFYASSKNKAMEFFEQFKKKRKDIIPSAVFCLERSINAYLTFFSFPEEEWISLRTIVFHILNFTTVM